MLAAAGLYVQLRICRTIHPYPIQSAISEDRDERIQVFCLRWKLNRRRLQTTPMKHLLKIKRKKSPEPPQQSVSSGRPSDIAAGLPASQTELDGILNGRQSFLSGSEGKST